jgi:hypothetical protein
MNNIIDVQIEMLARLRGVLALLLFEWMGGLSGFVTESLRPGSP